MHRILVSVIDWIVVALHIPVVCRLGQLQPTCILDEVSIACADGTSAMQVVVSNGYAQAFMAPIVSHSSNWSALGGGLAMSHW
jgi:hypothetical protein